MIVFTPIDLPKIEPDNWDVFWDIWNKHSASLIKTKMNTTMSLTPVGASGLWIGLDIVKKTPVVEPTWRAPFFDIKDSLPNLYNTLNTSIPDAKLIRLVQSQISFAAHTDDNKQVWPLRAYFYYTSENPQWYFTKPNDIGGERIYARLPSDTNWFAYNDHDCWHGTDFDPVNKKILLQVFGYGYYNTPTELLNKSIAKYKNYIINF
jgi:hypothetical protein